MRAFLVATLLVSACSFAEKHRGTSDAGDDDAGSDAIPIDAATPFGCEGIPYQITAPSVITFDGEAADLGTGEKSATMTITVEGGIVATPPTTITSAVGAFSLDVTTNGQALASHIKGTGTGYAPAFLYPGHPFTDDTTIALPTLKTAELGTVGNPAGTALIQFRIGDCLGTGMAGCTLAVTPAPSKQQYSRGGVPTASATDTEGNGYVVAYGVAAGSVTMTATCPGHTMRPQTITMIGDATYFVTMQP